MAVHPGETVVGQTRNQKSLGFKPWSGGSARVRPYTLPPSERRRLRDRAYRAQQRDQSEVCGVVLVGPGRVLRLEFLRNLAARPAAWEVTRRALRQAVGEAPPGWKVLGTFHSHVVGFAVPSPRDIREGFYRSHQLIYDVCGRETKLYRKMRHAGRIVARELRLASRAQG